MIEFENCIYYDEKQDEIYIIMGVSITTPIYNAPHIGVVDFVYLEHDDDMRVVRYFEFKKMKFIGFLE